MKLIKALLITLICCTLVAHKLSPVSASSFEDNDFAEFEDFDSDDDFVEAPATVGGGGGGASVPASSNEQNVAKEKEPVKVVNIQDDEEDGIVEDEDEFFKDDEEFEGFDGGDIKEETVDKKTTEPKLTVAKIPMHFR